MPPTQSGRKLSTAEILTLLAAGPPRLAELTARVPAARLQTPRESVGHLPTPPAPDLWSANAVLAHLRSCGDIWGGCIMTILAQDKPTLRAVNPRTWIKQTNYLELKFKPSLRAFTAQRTELLAVLELLTPKDWKRWATVSVAGKPYKRTVLFYAQWLAEHERPHLKQIERLVTA